MRRNVAAAVLMATMLAGVAAAEIRDAEGVRALAAGDAIQLAGAGEHAGGVLAVSGPDGVVSRHRFGASETPTFRHDGGLADGVYGWELTLSPRLTAEERARLREARAAGIDPVGVPQGRVLSGTFAVVDGALAGGLEEAGAPIVRGGAVANGILAPEDQVIPDDLIVQSSLCVGFDCVNGESFGFDTIRLKENSTRIKFEDTSVGSFPSNDWQLTANDSAGGGQNKFSIEDITGARVPFTVEAGSTTNSIYVDSTGRVGFRTSTPVLDLHVNTSNSPGIRLEQNSSGGFTAQSWDIAGNEANFFVRDVTGGSRLPFRIRPGAPTSSLDIAADGNVGIGTASADQKLEVAGGDVKIGRTTGGNTSFFIENTGGTLTSSWILRANGTTGGFTFTEAGGNTSFRINTGALTNALTVTSTGVDLLGTLRVGGVTMNVPDYVFDDEYSLLPIPDQGRFMSSNRHLPSVPPEQLGEDGRPQIDLVATQMGMLEEIEKAHLYIQQLHGSLGSAEQRIVELQEELAALRVAVGALGKEQAGRN